MKLFVNLFYVINDLKLRIFLILNFNKFNKLSLVINNKRNNSSNEQYIYII